MIRLLTERELQIAALIATGSPSTGWAEMARIALPARAWRVDADPGQAAL